MADRVFGINNDGHLWEIDVESPGVSVDLGGAM